MIKEITDIDSDEVAAFSRLTEAQLRNRLEPSMGIFIAESPKVIHLALDCGYTPVSLLMDRRHIQGQGGEIIRRCPDIPVYTADEALLARITGYKLTRGILCAMRRPPVLEAYSVCKEAKLVAVLENITDATNLGAIFRSAAALDVDGVLITPSCCDPFNRRAVRVSMGTVFQIPWTYVCKEGEWPDGGIKYLKELGFKCAAMALKGDSVSIDDERLKGEEKLAVILGTEGDGLSADTIADCDYTVKIPMSHGVDSLNVAAAAAVAFWQLRRARHRG